MIKNVLQKGRFILFLAIFYFSTVVLGALCTSNNPSDHLHHQKSRTHHSFSCLLACANMVTQDGAVPVLPTVLPVIGVLLSAIPFLLFQAFASILHSRGPPQAN